MTQEPNTPQQNFFLVIPAFVANDPNLDDSTKMLFGHISALSNQKGYCWASDQYLAELTNISVSVLKSRIKALEDNGYIVRETEKDGLKWDRKIFPVFNQKNFTKADMQAYRRPKSRPIEGLNLGYKQDKGINKKNTVPTRAKDCRVGNVEKEDTEGSEICDRLTKHPLFVATTTVRKARSWFHKNKVEAEENLTYLDKQLQKILYKHLKTAIAHKLSELSRELVMQFGSTSGCLTFGFGCSGLKTKPDAVDWKDILSEFLNCHNYHPFDVEKIINEIEMKALNGAEADIEKFKQSKNDKVKK